MATPRFVRRSNKDSTTDSICLACFRTIATTAREADLVSAEEKHICDPEDRSNVRLIDSQRRIF